jgi:hypothetical protein
VLDSIYLKYVSDSKERWVSKTCYQFKTIKLFVEYQHCKQENISLALDLIQKDDYLISIDIGDAYFSINIHDDYKKYLRFLWKGIICEFQVLCFGLAFIRWTITHLHFQRVP